MRPRRRRRSRSFRWSSEAGPLRSGDGVDDFGMKAGEFLEVLAALLLEAFHDRRVLIAASLPLIQLAWLQDLGIVDTRDGARHLIAEIRICLPLNRAFGDRLHDGAGVGDGHLLAAVVAIRASDAAGVEQIHPETARNEPHQGAVALL